MPTMVSLDIFLPDMPGWRILDRLKADLSTRHIPICIVSTDDSRDRALSSGAIGFISKPVASTEVIDRAIAQLADYVARPRKKVGLAMAAADDISVVQARLAQEAIDVVVTTDADEICELLRLDQLDCLVVQSGASDLQPADLIDVVEQRALTRQLPIIVYGSGGGDALSRWRRRDGVFALREARSLERLMDAVYFSLHRSSASCRTASARRSRICIATAASSKARRRSSSTTTCAISSRSRRSCTTMGWRSSRPTMAVRRYDWFRRIRRLTSF